MKRLSIITLSFLATLLFVGCEKVSTKDVSRVTNYPLLELLGEQFMTIDAGSTFNDPGATVTIGGQQSSPDISGAVDASTPGVYIITYAAKNADGFSASIRRWVGVIDAAAAANDFSGQYQRTKYGSNTTPSGIATWTKVMDGLYLNNDVGGVGAGTISSTPGYAGPFYIFNVEGNEIIFPPQPNPLGGDVSAVADDGGERIDFVPGPTGTDSYAWGLRGSGYGTPTRTFTKQ